MSMDCRFPGKGGKMKKIYASLVAVLLFCVSAVFFAACQKVQPNTPSDDEVSITAELSKTEVVVGETITLNYSASRGNVTVTYSKDGAASVTFTGTTFTPEEAGVYVFTFSAENADSVTKTLTVTAPEPVKPVITAELNKTEIKARESVTITYSATEGAAVTVTYTKDGQAIGIGAGQQSRIHCTRLAGSKADNWWLRQSPQVLGLQFVDGIKRADRDNAIDLYMGEDYMDVLADGAWENIFKVKPPVFTAEEKRAWLNQLTDVTLGSDAFFPFSDNIERAHKSGVKYIAQPGGSVRDDAVIECCDKYDMAMVFTGIRLFHH